MRRMRRNGALKVIVILMAVFLVVGTAIAIVVTPLTLKDIGSCTEYQCDVKNLRLATTIEIDKEGEDFATVSGNIFTFVVDPLTMYTMSGSKIAYAGDAYHFFAQDSHSIYVNDTISVEMVGLVKFFGEAYDIYDKAENKIASVTFNGVNTNGEMHDANGKLIADFNSKPFLNDFTVRITEDCTLDENTVLMIFCSYYSDQHADSAAANSNSHSSNRSSR